MGIGRGVGEGISVRDIYIAILVFADYPVFDSPERSNLGFRLIPTSCTKQLNRGKRPLKS
jgi:hypothetical protein